MVEKIGNFILELVPPPGTASFALGGPGVQGRLPWSAGVAAGYFVPPAQVFYFANDTTKQEWGIGTYTAGQLTRDTVLWTSAGSTAKLNFNTLPVYVHPDIPAERTVYRDPATGRLKVPYDISSATQNQGQHAGHRNRIINSGFQVNQNGYTSGVNNLAAHQYTLFDRWRTGPNGGGFTFTAQKPVTFGTVIGTVEQVIEGTFIEGGTYTLSWFGSGTARITYTGGSGVVTSAYTGTPFSITGVVAGTDVKIEFNNFSVVSKPQFEPGDTATPWEVRLNEQKLCERYFIVGNFDYAFMSNLGNMNFWYTIFLPTIMRAPPAVTIRPDASNTNVSNFFATALSNRDFQAQGLAGFSGTYRFSGQYTAIAELTS